MKLRKFSFIAAGCLIVLVAGASIVMLRSKPAYYIAYVTRGTISKSITDTGNVITSGEDDIYTPTNGIIKTLFVANGDTVHAGQPLFTVTSTATDSDKAQAYASYQSSITDEKTAEQNKKTLQAQLEKDRQAVLDAQGAVDQMNASIGGSKNNPKTGSPYTQNEINSINSTLTSSRETFSADEKKYLDADSAITSAKAAQQAGFLTWQQTQDAVVTAPAAGIISNLSVSVGDKVLTGPSSITGAVTPVLIMKTSDNLLIQVPCNETDITGVEPGKKASIVFDAIPYKKYQGTVTKLDTIGKNQQGVITYTIYLTLDKADTNIQPGMTVTVTMQTTTLTHVLRIPNTALITLLDGKKAVRVLPANTIVPIVLGLRSDTQSQVLSGVSEGTQISIGEK